MNIETTKLQVLEKIKKIELELKRSKESETVWRDEYVEEAQAHTLLKAKYEDYDIKEFVRLKDENKILTKDYEKLEIQYIGQERTIANQKQELRRLRAKMNHENDFVLKLKEFIQTFISILFRR